MTENKANLVRVSMSHVQSDPLVITSLNDVIEAATESAKRLGGQAWWRGHGAASWNLRPSVRRDSTWEHHENSLARHFKARARTRHGDCPADTDLGGWLFLMQQYRLPTRLLDWSESVLVATYFAVDDATVPTENGALWALNPSALNRIHWGSGGLLGAEDPGLANLFATAFLVAPRPETGKTVALGTHEVDARMMAQQSAFTLHDTATPLEEAEGSESCLLKFEIEGAAKIRIREQLESVGIRKWSLFPDLEGLARDIRETKWAT